MVLGGIGKGAVEQLLSDGFNVATFSRGSSRVGALKKQLAKQYPPERFLARPGNVQNEKDLRSIVSATIKKFGAIDILINNSGYGYFAPADKVDMNKFQDMIQTNLVGVASLAKLVVPGMKKKKNGLIINIASVSGKFSSPQGEFYSATKFGVMGYSEGLRQELRGYGIKVSTICPGMVRTNFFSPSGLKKRKQMLKKKGIKFSMLEVEDINRLISLICSQASRCHIEDVTVRPF